MAVLQDLYRLLLSFILGTLLGAFFFGGLWWTTRRLVTVKHPALLVLVSFLVRSALVLGGFYLLLSAGWSRTIAALAGFILARVASFFILRPRREGARAPELKGDSSDDH